MTISRGSSVSSTTALRSACAYSSPVDPTNASPPAPMTSRPTSPKGSCPLLARTPSTASLAPASKHNAKAACLSPAPIAQITIGTSKMRPSVMRLGILKVPLELMPGRRPRSPLLLFRPIYPRLRRCTGMRLRSTEPGRPRRVVLRRAPASPGSSLLRLRQRARPGTYESDPRSHTIGAGPNELAAVSGW